MSTSLYIHIPFCLKRCIYCDFVSGSYEPKKADTYIEALIHELSGIPNNAPLSTLFIGGGTPTALSTETLSRLLTFIFNRFDFQNNETTIEANPGTLDKDKLQTIYSQGINRLSIGVQSFNSDELEFLGRIHSPEEAEQAVNLARLAGFENIGIDLIYGIPGQDISTWKETLAKAVALEPHHISTYELTVEEGTDLYLMIKNVPSASRPPLTRAVLDEDLIIDMYNYTIDYLTSKGYEHYEISNFSRPGYQCKHNLNYWDRGEYYGAGIAAHSFINRERFYNTDNIDTYIKTISAKKTAVTGSEFISTDTALSEAIFLGLRKIEGVNIESLSKEHNVNILTTYVEEIKVLLDAGLIETSASKCSYETDLRLTRKGLLLSNEVFTTFIHNS